MPKVRDWYREESRRQFKPKRSGTRAEDYWEESWEQQPRKRDKKNPNRNQKNG